MTNECDDNKPEPGESDEPHAPVAEDSHLLAQARKSLHSIGNKSHKNQLLPFQWKFAKKTTQEQESQAFNKAVVEGNFPKVISILASQKTDEDRNRVMNEARHRGVAIDHTTVEKDEEEDSTIINNKLHHHHDHKGWYDLTPLALAAMNGHANVVEYLLRQGADPTLRGSPSQHEDLNAMEAAKKGVKLIQQDIDSVLSSGKDEMFHLPNTHHYSQFTSFWGTGGETESASSALDYARSLVEKRDQCHLCLAMLESVEQFWPLAQAYSSHYRKRTYTNRPTNIRVLRRSLDFITLETTSSNYSTESSSDGRLQAPSNVASKESLVNRLAAKIAAAGAKQVKPADPLVLEEYSDYNNGYTGRKHQPQPNNQKAPPRGPKRTKKNRGRRHSDSFCIPPPARSRPVLARAGSFLRDKNVPNIQFV